MIKNVRNCIKLYEIVLFCTLMYGVDSDIVIVEKFDHRHHCLVVFLCVYGKPKGFFFPSYLSPLGAGSIPAAHIICQAACIASAVLQRTGVCVALNSFPYKPSFLWSQSAVM